MRDDRLWFLDILEAAARIEEHAAKGREAFLRDEFLQVWMLHHLQIIGEVAAGLSQELRARHPQPSWRAAIALRNVVVHQYFVLDLEEIWKAATVHLPPFKRQVQQILAEIDSQGI
ncbi:MAG: DUF86 domain-containing protein [Candidatus Tectomicrobia bacterium]|uniref:DUF86 domain-containing protein n=1 Tax=Tectimicrobiota bacterium TaxID=2528274 RepID=A0A932MMK9_UNCTE|nr:DUF86 domain-containing protein [Candidatus Tectomicrobia bacterium]